MELADQQNTENQEQIANAESPQPVIGRDKPQSIRDTILGSIKEINSKSAGPEQDSASKPSEDGRPRDEQGRFAPKQEAAPAKVEAPKETPPAEVKPEAPKAIGKPPGGWEDEAKAVFETLPDPVKRAVLKREDEVSNGFKKYEGIDEALDPIRPALQAAGVKTTAEAVKRLVQWEGTFRNPNTAASGVAQLIQMYGINPQNILQQLGINPAQSSPAQQQDENPLRPVLDEFGNIKQTVSSLQSELQRQREDQISRELATFAKDKPHFDKVRMTMGQLIQAGIASDLDNAYQKAVALDPEIQAAAKAEEEAKRVSERPVATKAKAAVSPSPRAPAAPASQAKKGNGSVRDSILNSIAEVRANGRA